MNSSDTGLGQITDNDGAPDVLIGDATVDEAAGTASFGVTLTNPSAADITLTLTTADGSATAGADYTATTSQVTILAGATTATGTFDVPILEDLLDESDETFTVSVQSVDAGTVGSTADTGLGTITDNEVFGFSVSVNPTSINEVGGSPTGTVTLDFPRVTDITIDVSSGDTGEATLDINRVTITAGTTAATFVVSGVDDGIDDSIETVVITADAGESGVETTTIDVVDNDTAALELALTEASITEDGTTVLTVSLSIPRAVETVVSLAVDDATEATLTPMMVTIPANQTLATATATVTGVTDNLVDGSQAAEITASATGLANATTSLTVTDVDVAASSLLLADTSISENGGTTTGTLSWSAA